MDEEPESVQTYNFGVVISGQVVRHTFEFQNDLDEPLRIADEQNDIQSSCGCTRAKVLDHRLESKQVTRIALEVKSDNKQGPIREFAKIRWTSDSGAEVVTMFHVEAIVKLPIAFTPRELFFSKNDVATGKIRQVVCKPDRPVDWQYALFQCSDPFVKIVGRRQLDDNSLALDIQCEATHEGVGRQSELKIWIPNSTVESDRNDEPLTATLSIASHDPAALRITPACVLFRTMADEASLLATGNDQATQKLQATLIASGDILSDDVQLVGIRAADLEIKNVNAQRISRDAMRITVVAVGTSNHSETSPLDESSDDVGILESGRLDVHFSSGDHAIVDYRVPTAATKRDTVQHSRSIDAVNSADSQVPVQPVESTPRPKQTNSVAADLCEPL